MRCPPLFMLAVLALSSLQAGIVTREVSYPSGSVTAKGFLAAPDGKAKHPGILVLHEFWGLNDYPRSRARMLAELGYVALAVDLYGDGKVATHPQDATAFANAVNNNIPEARKRFEAAMKFLQSQPEVDPEKSAAIGYCFGGGLVLQMAVDGVSGLLAVASFHGSLAESPSGPIRAKILVCHGGDDVFSTPQMAADFQKNFEDAGADLTFITYPGAKHSFTNPDATKLGEEFNLPIAYDAEADAQSWAELQKFLKDVFPEPSPTPSPKSPGTPAARAMAVPRAAASPAGP